MIPAHVIQRIRRIHIKSKRTVNTLMAGQYRSVFRGTGIEFEEVREYVPGDEVKSIDWNVSARLGRPFVKRYREERESIVILLIDMSRSLSFGTHFGTKLEKVAELASVLAFNAIKNNDKVGVVFFTDRVEKYIPPKKGSAHVWQVIKEIFTFVPEGRGTDIETALTFMSRVVKKRSLSFLISDFFCPPFEQGLKIANRRHEMVGIRVYDTGAFDLPEKGILTLRDFETLETLTVDAGSRRTRDWFSRQRTLAHERVAALFTRARVDLVEMATRDSVADVLTRYFRLREKRGR